MLDFRKALLALSVAGLGLVGTASAQVSCTTAQNTGAAPAVGVRNEGITEQFQPYQVTACTGTPDTTSITLSVTASVPVTNVLLTGTITNQVDSIAVAVGFAANPLVAYGTSTPGSSTVTYTISGVNTGGPVGGGANIQVFNIRGNVSGLGANAYATLTGAAIGAGLAVPNTAVNSVLTQTSLVKPTFNAFGNIGICGVLTTDVNAVGIVGIKEAFTAALTSDNDEYGKETGALAAAGALANPTSVAPPFPNPITAAGTAVGTRLALTFGNLASGVNYYLPVQIVSGTLTLNLVATATTPANTPLAGGTIGANTNKGNVGATAVSGVYGFTATGGTFTAYYAVLAESLTTTESTNFGAAFGASGLTTSAAPLYVGGSPFPTIELFEQTSATAVPNSVPPSVSVVIVGNTSNYGQFLAPSSPTVVTASAGTFTIRPMDSTLLADGTGYLTACNTTLLFPYLVTLPSIGYDSGIAIANTGLGTSTIPGNTFTTTTTGSCSITLWGSGSIDGAAITPINLAPVTVTAGQVNAFTLGTALPTAQPTFAGYGLAICNFIGAHAFVQISDYNGMANAFSETYLAPVLSDIYGAGGYTTINTPF